MSSGTRVAYGWHRNRAEQEYAARRPSMARTTVGGIVREAIRGKAEIGIGELYRAVASHENAPDLSQSDMRHRVRSAVHTLSKEGVLARVGDGVYAVRGHGGE